MNITPIQNYTNHNKPSFKAKITDIPKLPCAICGEEMLPAGRAEEIYKKFVHQTNAGMKAKDALRFFFGLLPFLPPLETKIVSNFEQLANAYPDQRFSEILQIPEVITPHIKAKAVKTAIFNTRTAPFSKTAFSLISDKVPKESFTEIFTQAKGIATGRTPDHIKRYKINRLFAPITLQISDTEKADKFSSIIARLPLVDFDENDLLVKLSKKDDEGIMRSFVRSRKAISAHLGGIKSSAQEKMACVCEKCHSSTGEMSLDDYFRIFPNFVNNIESQIKALLSIKDNAKYGFTENLLAKKVQFINANSPDEKISFPNLKVKIKANPQKEKEDFLAREPQVARMLRKYMSAKEQSQFLDQLRSAISTTKPNSKERERYKMIYDLFLEKYRKTVHS